MTRQRLPNRRVAETRRVRWTDHDGTDRAYQITIGYYPDGRPAEVFAAGTKEGADIDLLMADACVLLSHALQRGAQPAELLRSMLKRPTDPFGWATAPASPVGAIVEALATEGAE